MYSPISAECHDVPHAVITMRLMCLSSSSDMLSPCTRAEPSSSSRWPRSVFSRLSGCSKISFSMKWSKPPRSIVARSHSIWLTGLSMKSFSRLRMR